MRQTRYNSFLIYFVIFLIFGSGLWIQSINSINLPNIVQDTVTLTLGVLFEALPFVILGILISVLIQLFMPSSFIFKILPKKASNKRAILSLSGFLMPVCECGNVPVARGLMAKGLRPQDVLTFLLAAPILNPITLLTTSQAFPTQPEILIIRAISAFAIANFVGWIFSTVPKKELITESFNNYCEDKSHSITHRKNSPVQQIRKFAMLFKEEFDRLLPALVTGSLIAGLIQTVVPRSWIISISNEPALAIIAMIVLAFVVSICANVDAFFALSLSGIFPVSAIIAFLVFGPMIDLKMLSLLRTTYTSKALATLTLIVFLCTFVIGLGAHYVL